MNGTAGLILSVLRPYGLRQESATEWRCNSPLRPGANSLSFKLTLDGDENGAYYDHVSSDKGSLYELAAALNIAVERKTVTDTKRVYANLTDYAEAHGVPVSVLTKIGWSEVQTHQGRAALAFKTASGTRYRFIDGQKPPYKSEVGYKACWYGLNSALQMAKETAQPLVICNGEISTAAAQHHGVAACCVTGGEKAFPNGLVAQLLQAWQGEVILAFDCDVTGQKTAQDVRLQLSERNPVVVDLGFGKGGDLADFCKLYGDQAVAELRKRALVQPPASTRKSDVEHLADAVNQLHAALRADAKIAERQDLEAVLAKVQAEIDRIQVSAARSSVLSFEDIARDNLALIDFRRENPNPIIGLRCNIPTLDKAIGGFEPEMYVIYGATSMGKSTLAVSFAREFLRQGPGFIATTESNPRRWMFKLAASMSHIPSDRIETGQLNDAEYHQIKATYAQIAAMGCHMLEHGSPTVSDLRASMLLGMEKYGYEWAIVDSASKMNSPGSPAIYDTTRNVSNGLQTLMQELNIPFVLTTQVGRDVSERPAGKKLPLLEDGYGGGVIEQNAGVVLGLYNHQYYVDLGTEPANEVTFPKETALVRILKNRWRGDARINSVRLKFVGGAGFYELETHQEARP